MIKNKNYNLTKTKNNLKKMSALTLFQFTENEGLEFSGKQIRTNEDGYACVFDLIEVATGQSRNAARDTWVTMKRENSVANSAGWSCSVIPVRFPGLQRETPGARAAQVVEIVMALPGVKARQFRRNAAKVLVRYLGGDVTLLDDVRENAVREDGPSRFFQAEVARQHQPMQVDDREHEYRMLKLKTDLEMSRLEIHRSELELENKRFAERLITNSENFTDILVKQTMRDFGINYLNASASGIEQERYIDVPQILRQLGLPQKDSGKYGRVIARRFREHFQREPKRAIKVVNGSHRECMVYSVTEVEIIKTWISEWNSL